jgi:AraC-like DNA-binding protein
VPARVLWLRAGGFGSHALAWLPIACENPPSHPSFEPARVARSRLVDAACGRLVNDSSSLPVLPAAPLRRVLAGAPVAFEGRNAIEGYVDRLNRASPVADRRIVGWSREGLDRLAVGAALNRLGPSAPEVFLGECRFGFGLELVTRSPDAAPASYVVGLPLAGELSVTLRDGEVRAQAGEGVVFDPADVERTEVSPGAHLVEFHLPRLELQRLAMDWAPGLDHGKPTFVPHVGGGLSTRLLFMAAQAARVLETEGPPGGARMLFRRWLEMMSLTLLQEQPIANAFEPRLPFAAAGPTPPGVRRALDFIHAHADGEIGLADIAQAACTSASTLLRHFQAHVGLTPAACLRRVRLERARVELQAAEPAAIRDIALRWGFQNASKFSAAYQVQFGERPSESRSRKGSGGAA